MLSIEDPQKQQLARLVKELFEKMQHEGSSKEPLVKFIEADWADQADISYADLGELVIEAVMCSCATVVAVEPGRHHHPGCPMWGAKEGYEEDGLPVIK